MVARDVPVVLEWLGTTEGAVDADIRAQVSGYLISRDYREGQPVEAGTLLFRIDPRPFQAALDEARGDLGRAEAALELSRLDVNRCTPLVATGAVRPRRSSRRWWRRRARRGCSRTSTSRWWDADGAGQKSFRPKDDDQDQGGSGGSERDFHGGKVRCHRSTDELVHINTVFDRMRTGTIEGSVVLRA